MINSTSMISLNFRRYGFVLFIWSGCLIASNANMSNETNNVINGSYSYWFNQANILIMMHQGNSDQAVVIWKKLLQINNTDITICANLAQAYLNMKTFKQAKNILDHDHCKKPNSHMLLLQCGH